MSLDGTGGHIQHRGVTAIAADPTIRRQVVAAEIVPAGVRP